MVYMKGDINQARGPYLESIDSRPFFSNGSALGPYCQDLGSIFSPVQHTCLINKNKNKTQTAVTNICLNCITFINLTFRMLQHTSSEVIIIQLQINLNSTIQLYGLGTNEID